MYFCVIWKKNMKTFLAWFLRKVIHYRSDVVMVNLSRCFPNRSYEEIREIHKRFYLHLATIFTEMLWMGTCRGKRGRDKFRRSHKFEFANPEEYNRLAAFGRPILLLEAHTGNWELMGGLPVSSYGVPLDIRVNQYAVTYLALHNKRADRLVEWIRTGILKDTDFNGYVETSRVMRYVLERKDKPFLFTFITDQYPYTGHKEPIKFMNQDTFTMTGGAGLASKLDMVVAYLRFECRDGGGYTLSVVPICEHAAQMDPDGIMKKYYQLLEEDLEKQPWNYLWTHKRWK